ncbi:MAG: NADH-quinone oxidoreductase subunit L [Anaerolineales bacterium]|nr:NADH-quinone oxidoreductase subunit L [Anaerolineales bacterium]
MNAFGLAPLLLVFPAIGVLFNAFAGRRLVEADRKTGEKYAGWFASLMALSAFVVATLLFFSLQAHDFHAETVHLFNWIDIPSAGFTIPWAIQVDTLSVAMMLVVSGVGTLIHIYAIGYMHGDPGFHRFFAYLNLFLFFMLILVSGSSYLMLFVGWEGVGLCSYLLIGFWFDRKNAEGKAMNADAGRKAFIVNRVGDLAMILAMILLFWTFKSLDFSTVFASAVELFEHGEGVMLFGTEMTVGGVLTAVTFLFLLGAAGKSAQIPFYVWLPDAMAGPTPVSALIHAATMVTSGIYLMVRSNVLLEIARASASEGIAGATILGLSSPDWIALTGAATALLAGLIAFTQFDIKKVLAYSTVSQLGFMIAAAGMGAYVAAMFHLITHAFFKALLFLSSGSVIHGMEHGHHHLHDHGHGDDHHADDPFDPQDMRTMGGLRHKMQTTFVVYMIGALALAGIVPLAGFWSKDEILAHANTNEGLVFTIVYWMLTVAAVCTAFYMGRQLKMVFFGEPRHAAAEHASESSPLMTRPLMVLAALAVLGGLLNLPFFSESAYKAASAAHDYGIFLGLEHWLEHSIAGFELTEEGIVHMPHTPTWLQLDVAAISTVLALAALGLAMFVVYRSRPQTAAERDPLQSTPIWWFAILPFEWFYMHTAVPAFKWLARWLADTVDWAFWHDFVHNNLIRDTFRGFANFSADVLDANGVDGLVNGSGRLTRFVGSIVRRTQTGYARNYALGVFLGTVILLAYFIFAG